ncbi:TadE/TadG family type IV pilus assembly protein [Alteriqipengyuania sp.]|uniref:TadE/TadG family type IV pilus assembly protein n=1 Tax=Alteriqipengyuania sp. TaxID=2800692 RepID=UPI003511B678
MRRLVRLIDTLRRDQAGATLVEFAIIAPTFMILLMGAFDLGHSVYLRAVLNGAIHEAARDSTLESGEASETTIDNQVETIVQKVAKSADVDFERKSYYDFTDVERAETINESGTANGVCDSGETFEDENGNNTWDSDVGATGFGGPRDIVMYTVTVTYDRLFPLYGLIGMSQENSMSVSTVLKNQPFGQQGDAATPETKPCP